MNEILFLLHILLVVGFALGALRLGKEALIAFVTITALLANLLVLKQMRLFGLVITCTDVFAVGSILGLNLLQEYYGRDSSSKAAWICFYLITFFALMSQIHLAYKPSYFDMTQSSYFTILAPAPRLLLASLAVFFFVQQFDIRFYSVLKKGLSRAPLMVRNGISLIISQLLDTALFSVLGLYGLVDSLADIILFSFAVKLFIIFSITPFISLSRYIALTPYHDRF